MLNMHKKIMPAVLRGTAPTTVRAFGTPTAMSEPYATMDPEKAAVSYLIQELQDEALRELEFKKPGVCGNTPVKVEVGYDKYDFCLAPGTQARDLSLLLENRMGFVLPPHQFQYKAKLLDNDADVGMLPDGSELTLFLFGLGGVKGKKRKEQKRKPPKRKVNLASVPFTRTETVAIPIAAPEGDQTFQSFTVNPRNFPWLAANATQYEQYSIVSLVAQFRTNTSATTPGTFVMAFDMNPNDGAPTSVESISAYDKRVIGKVREDHRMHLDVKAANANGRFYNTTQATSADHRLYDAATLYFMAYGLPVELDNKGVGTLEITYTIRMYVPCLPPAGTQAQDTLKVYFNTRGMGALPTTTETAEFYNTETNGTNTQPVNVDADDDSYIPLENGMWSFSVGGQFYSNQTIASEGIINVDLQLWDSDYLNLIWTGVLNNTYQYANNNFAQYVGINMSRTVHVNSTDGKPMNLRVTLRQVSSVGDAVFYGIGTYLAVKLLPYAGKHFLTYAGSGIRSPVLQRSLQATPLQFEKKRGSRPTQCTACNAGPLVCAKVCRKLEPVTAPKRASRDAPMEVISVCASCRREKCDGSCTA